MDNRLDDYVRGVHALHGYYRKTDKICRAISVVLLTSYFVRYGAEQPWTQTVRGAWCKRMPKTVQLPMYHAPGSNTATSSTSTLTTLTRTSPHLYPQPYQIVPKQRSFRMTSHTLPPLDLNKPLPPPAKHFHNNPAVSASSTLRSSSIPGLRAVRSISSLGSWCSITSESSASSTPPLEPPPRSRLRPGPSHVFAQERFASRRPSLCLSASDRSASFSGPCPTVPLPRWPEDSIPPVPPVPRLPSASQFKTETSGIDGMTPLQTRPRSSRSNGRGKDLYKKALVRRASMNNDCSLTVPLSYVKHTTSMSNSTGAPKSILKKSGSEVSMNGASTTACSERYMKRKPSNLSFSINIDDTGESRLTWNENQASISDVDDNTTTQATMHMACGYRSSAGRNCYGTPILPPIPNFEKGLGLQV